MNISLSLSLSLSRKEHVFANGQFLLITAEPSTFTLRDSDDRWRVSLFFFFETDGELVGINV